MNSPLPSSDALAAQLQADPATAMNWHRLGVAYAREGKISELLNLCDLAAPHFGDGALFFHNITIDLSQSGEWQVIVNLAAGIPRDRLEYPIALYYRGCADVAAGNHIAALDVFQMFKDAILPRHKAYPIAENANLNTIFRQGTLVENRPETEKLLAKVPTRMPPPLEWRHAVDKARVFDVGYLVSVCMDARYFHRFAEDLLSGYADLNLTAPVHLHVIAPDADTCSRMDALAANPAGLSLAFSTEAEGPWKTPVYYTCARFFVAEQLLRDTGRPVVCMDGDSVPTVRPDRIVSALGEQDFAIFKTDRTEPASVYQAGVMAFAPSETALSFLSNVQRFILGKLDTPPILAWMLDQAALYSVLTLSSQSEPDFGLVNLTEALSTDLGSSLRHLSDEGEKQALMNAP